MRSLQTANIFANSTNQVLCGYVAAPLPFLTLKSYRTASRTRLIARVSGRNVKKKRPITGLQKKRVDYIPIITPEAHKGEQAPPANIPIMLKTRYRFLNDLLGTIKTTVYGV